ncbi:hypothetical protein [Alkalihalobacterium bogoriense]|uniref:hypothetical protein n=1 Tax=Alkalihalobacterium bogoriense TaxID=246272 RepID=UPI00047E751A|nr:hypothetical protein [Alkalihalobacterium bogoriense]
MYPEYYNGVHGVEYRFFQFAGNKKGLSEVGFLTQFFLQDKSIKVLKAYSRRAKAAHLRVSPQEKHLGFTIKSGQGSALRLKRKDAPAFFLLFRKL